MGALPSFVTTLSPTSKPPRLRPLPPSSEAQISEALPEIDGIPHWHINVPEGRRSEQCPDSLKIRGSKQGSKGISERDKGMISVPAETFQYQSWADVCNLIDQDQIDLFQRAPVNHRKYLNFKYYIEQSYGSLFNFIKEKKLGWTDTDAKSAPFTNPDDYKIIFNDWSYGFDPRIVHLCVWTKFPLDNDPKTERLLPEVKQQIDDYVEKAFRSRIPAENVRWFKNWPNLKSIPDLEHFHVLMFEPDMGFVKEITNNGFPLDSVL